MKNVVHFEITKGDTHYVASAREFFIVTQGKTFDELLENIKEATELHFEVLEEDLAEKWSRSPSLELSYEIPSWEHAKA